MELFEIQGSLASLNSLLIEKGFSYPSCAMNITCDSVKIWLNATGTETSGNIFENIRGETFYDVFNAARLFIEKLVSVEEHQKKTAVKNFGQAIDGLRSAGFEATFTDPLAASLQTLSENLLTKD